MKIVGFFGFEKSVSLKAETLNRKIGIKIGNFQGRLLTPSLPNDFYKKSEDYRKPLIQPKSAISFNEHLEWGRPYSWPSGNSEIFNFMLEINVDNKNFDDKEKKILIDSTETWINRLKHNLFAFDYFLEHKGSRVRSTSSLGFEYYIKIGENKPQEIESNRQDIIEIKLLTNAIDFKTLKKVLNSTSKNKKLCVEYQLIKNSKIALENHEYRKSIFECASALELCLTNLLKFKLKVNNEKLRTHILKMNNSIEKKVKLLETIDVKLPSNKYLSDVSEIRNRAIHAGVDVTEEQAENAFRIVKSSLDILIKNRLV
jgi:HEPN domain-containing protein